MKRKIRAFRKPARRSRAYAIPLTADELCLLSELSPENLYRLNQYRLLIPNTTGKYRTKLVGWAKKLSYLLNHGWQLSEIKRWAHGRAHSNNPKQWPPDRGLWRDEK